MLGASTRLMLSPTQSLLLDELAADMSRAARTIYQRTTVGGLEESRKAAYDMATGMGLTAHQANSVTTLVAQWRATDSGQQSYRLASKSARCDKQKKELVRVERRVKQCAQALVKSLEYWNKQKSAKSVSMSTTTKGANKKVCSTEKVRAKTTSSATAKWLRNPTAQQLKAAQKISLHPRVARQNLDEATRLYEAKKGAFDRSATTRDELTSPEYRPHRVFGSRKLLNQRQRIGQLDSPWATVDAWQSEWDRRRNSSFTLIGVGADPGGNRGAVITWEKLEDGTPGPTGFMRMRLSNKQVEARRAEKAKLLGVSVESVPMDTELKNLIVPVQFVGSQGDLLRRAQADGQPITITISRKPLPKERKKLEKLNKKSAAYSRHPNAKRVTGKAKLAWIGRSSQKAKLSKKDQEKQKFKLKNTRKPTGLSTALLYGTYVTAAFETPKAENLTTRQRGAVGIDLNGWGLSFAAVTFDGNMQFLDPKLLRDSAQKEKVVALLDTLNIRCDQGWLKQAVSQSQIDLAFEQNRDDESGTVPRKISGTKESPKESGNSCLRRGPALKGDLPISTERASSAQIRAQTQTYVNALVELALVLGFAISLEDLDFSSKKAYMRDTGPNYNRMLHRLPTDALTAMVRSRCAKKGVALHQVNPAWTSVAGFAKYGFLLGLNPDQAGSFAIGRAAVLGSLPKGAAKPVPTRSASTGKKLSPKFVRTLQARKDDAVIRFQEIPRLARPVRCPTQRTEGKDTGVRIFESWLLVRKTLGPRSQWLNSPRIKSKAVPNSCEGASLAHPNQGLGSERTAEKVLGLTNAPSNRVKPIEHTEQNTAMWAS